MSFLYLDTSVAVHALAGGVPARAWLDEVTSESPPRLASSRLLRTELTRVLRREGRDVAEGRQIFDNVAMLPISESILASAEAITDHLKTLDAIHLASALALGSQTLVVTHDENLMRVAAALGLDTLDPVEA